MSWGCLKELPGKHGWLLVCCTYFVVDGRLANERGPFSKLHIDVINVCPQKPFIKVSTPRDPCQGSFFSIERFPPSLVSGSEQQALPSLLFNTFLVQTTLWSFSIIINLVIITIIIIIIIIYITLYSYIVLFGSLALLPTLLTAAPART